MSDFDIMGQQKAPERGAAGEKIAEPVPLFF
jgi:hypothetical protein